MRVLLVEDNPTNRQVMGCILNLIQAEMISAENGLEGVQAFQKDVFDIVLMDLQMPVMDGYTAIREIRALEARENRPRTPIVVVSANVAAGNVAAARQNGADQHLAKPINVTALLSTIAAAIEDAPAASAETHAGAAG